MKVSNLIKQIIQTATEKFGTSDHNNDTIDVGIFFDQDEEFQVWLQRPHHYSLLQEPLFGIISDRLEKQAVVTKFNVSDVSLVKALKKLNKCVENAESKDFDFSVTT